MADVNTFPGVGALNHDNDKVLAEPGLYSADSSSRRSEASNEADAKLDRVVRWKRDLTLVPILGLLHTIMFLDRTNIANARIEGLEEDLNMPSNGYNYCLWIFYIPFVLAEVPSNLFLTLDSIKPRFFLGSQTFILGILGMCQGLTRSYGGLLAVRFLMGIFEASLPAGAAYMFSRYYTKREASVRFAWFFIFGQAGPLFSGLLAYAIENLDGSGDLEGWRWIFIVEGLATVIFAVPVLTLLPDFPHQAREWFLKAEERERLLLNLEASRGEEQHGSVADNTPLRKILLDWRIHLFTLAYFCCDMTASSLAGFIPTILNELHWTASLAQVMTIPVWTAGIVATLSITVASGRVELRFPFLLGCICVQLAGWIIMRVYVPQPGVRYFALFLLSTGTFPQMAILMGWLSSNLRGRKYLAVGMAWMVGFGNCANLVSSNVFITTERPRYPTGFTVGLGSSALGFCLVCIGTAVLFGKNRSREKRRLEMSADEKVADDRLNFRFHL